MIKTTRSFKSISLSLLSSVLLFTSAATPALAENWTLNGTNIYKNNSGNVGIGTTTPTSLLHVNVATGAYGAIRVSEGATPALDFGDATGGGVNGIAALFSGGVEKIRLFADPTQNSWINAGNLGIGTSSPDSKLTVDGSTKILGSSASTPLLTVESYDDSKYSTIITGPNPGLAIRNSNDPATTGLYKFVSSGNAFMLFQNTAAGGDFSSFNNIMTWKAGGNVGIGTAAPTDPLHVSRSGAGVRNRLRLEVAGNTTDQDALITFSDVGENKSWSLGADDSSDVFTISNSAELGTTTRMLIDNSGNVGIGTTTPGYKLDVSGTARVAGDLAIAGEVDVVNNVSMGGYLIVLGTSNLYGAITAQSTLSVIGGNLRADKNDGLITTASITSTGWKTQAVTFPAAWTVVPTVVATRYDGGTGVMNISEIKISGTTLTGFTLKFNVTSLTTAGTVQFNWMAL